MNKIIATIRNNKNKESEAKGTRRGYYLVKGDTRYFISSTVSESALSKVADRVLSDVVGWDYWIDYSHGEDVFGNAAWSNIDATDNFI